MNIEEQEAAIRERREALFQMAVMELEKAAHKVEEFGYTVVCRVTPKK